MKLNLLSLSYVFDITKLHRMLLVLALLFVSTNVLAQCPSTGCTTTISGADSGTYTITGGQKICLTSDAVFTGTINLHGGVLENCATATQTFTLSTSSLSPGSTVNNYGVIRFTGAYSLKNATTFNNFNTWDVTGEIRLENGTILNNNGTVSSGGDFTTSSSSVLNNYGTLTVANEYKENSGTDLNNYYGGTINASSFSVENTWFNSGSINISGDCDLNSTSSGTIDGGCLSCDNFTNRSVLNGIACGTITVANNSDNQSTASLTGNLSLVDLTPPGSAPFIDNNNGTIDPTVQWTSCGCPGPFDPCTDVSGTDSDGDGINDVCDLDDDNDGIPDSVELGTLVSTEQQPCGGDTSLDFSAPAVLVSGTDLMQGAVYRIANIQTGMDALITIAEINNATVVEIDRNVTTPESFKPRTGFSFTNVGEYGYIEYNIQFVNSGGSTPQVIPKFFMNFNDLDGGANFGEQNWADNPKTYTIDDPTEVTMNTDGTWIVATGATSDYGPSTNEFPYINFAVNYTSKSDISIRVGAVARVPGASSSARSHSIEFDCITNYVAPHTYSLDGDFDGLANHLDLDSDNDGILDAVESGHSQSHTNGVLSGPYGDNGLADIVETSPESNTINYTLTDTDGVDGSNFLDVDSDSDSCYDALEGTAGYGYSDLDFINGQLSAAIDANGLPGGVSQGIGSSTNNSVLADVCENSGAMIDFDGVDDYVEVPTSVLNSLGEFTLSFWLKPETLPTGSEYFHIIGQKDRYDINMHLDTSGNTRVWSRHTYNSGSSSQSIASNPISTNEWVHFAFVVNYTTNRVYVYQNGEHVSTGGTSGGAPYVNSNPLRMGSKEDIQPAVGDNFNGWLDEVRIFDINLTKDQIQRMVYQEIENKSGNVHGSVTAKDIVDIATDITIPWSNLISYYPMKSIVNNKLIDESAYDNKGALHNITTFQEQSAPLPYETVADGPWTTEGTWLHGDVWDIEDIPNNKPWSIVHIKNDVTTSASHTQLGMLIDSGKSLGVSGDNEINNSWYLQLDGTIDLANDSQLIQTENSDLVTSASGKILRRQEGNTDVFWYNYWSSPVGTMGATTLTDNNAATNNANNTPYNLSMLKDGTGTAFQFTSAFDEAGKISDRWLYNFQNGLTYWDWVTINPSSDITPGFGYSQKGTGNAGLTQQYIFEGKPNNGTILIAADDVDVEPGGESIQDVTLTTTLIGNPYPSALDADEFIRDNIDFDNGGANPIIQGTILLWEQWAGNTHWLSEYEGGYGYINLTETARAYQHPDITIADPTNTDNRGIKTPTKFLPVGQGFFVEVVNDGNIEFNNSQRVFKSEGLGDSVFFRGEQALNENNETTESVNRIDESVEIPMQTIKLELGISNGATRRFVLGFGDQTTDDFDIGYDGGLISQKPDNDMASVLNGNPYVIQAFSPMTPEKEVDLYFNSSGDMTFVLDIVEMKNIDEYQDVFIRDNRQNMTWNLSSDGAYHFSAEAGEDNERFDLIFRNEQSLSTNEEALNKIKVFANNNVNKLYILGMTEDAKSLTLTNILGQSVKSYKSLSQESLQNGLDISNLSTGVYIVSITTENGWSFDKKVIIE